jgi:hypothetical protein
VCVLLSDVLKGSRISSNEVLAFIDKNHKNSMADYNKKIIDLQDKYEIILKELKDIKTVVKKLE